MVRRNEMIIALALVAGAGCTEGGVDLSTWRGDPGASCAGFVIDGRFGSLDDPACAEWQVEPMRGRFGDLYVAVDPNSDLIVLNDWHLRDDAPAEADMYNLFCLATELGVFEVRVFGDQHVEAWLDGERIDEQVEGASGFGPSPLTAKPHTIFEFRLATLPSTMRVLECDPAGGTMRVPAPPPEVTLSPQAGCFPGSAIEITHNLVREPTIFDVELGPHGVVRARTTTEPSIFGADGREMDAGEELTIYGTQLGEAGAMFFGERPAEVIAWSESRATVRVPDTAGTIEVRALVDGARSNPLRLMVRSAGCVPTCGECGDDGCGGRCGDCEAGFTCASATCVPELLE
jgi:hypothetical protein